MVEQSVDYIRKCYDAVALEYAERFVGELRHKPLDRELLSRLANEVSERGEVCDLGCGPGHTTAYLHSCGVHVFGLDISAENLREATRLHPGVVFEQGNMLDMPRADGTVAGVVAFYSIVHFSPAQLRRALAEMYRVVRPEGRLLLAFHAGEGEVHVKEFLGHPVTLDFAYFRPAAIADELAEAGFVKVEVIERDPYPDVEYSSRRAYVFASKRKAGEVSELAER
jgi:SAM-dependent methyltransferase